MNVGAGTITCNYDGVNKHQDHDRRRCICGKQFHIGCTVRLGSGSYVAAGSVITTDVEEDALALARERQTTKPGWAKTRRERKACVAARSNVWHGAGKTYVPRRPFG